MHARLCAVATYSLAASDIGVGALASVLVGTTVPSHSAEDAADGGGTSPPASPPPASALAAASMAKMHSPTVQPSCSEACSASKLARCSSSSIVADADAQRARARTSACWA